MTFDSPMPRSRASRLPEAKVPELDEIVVGKDVLELLSSAMYVDPMTVYREYVQNAADAVDVAKRKGVLGDQPGLIDITLVPEGRIVRIRDNGIGIPAHSFARTLLALGASQKRGSDLRGFRGVGRLAGLAYAQELVFRSRTAGEAYVSELRWDCRKLKAALRGDGFEGRVEDLIQYVTSVAKLAADEYPDRFFEVELRGVIRLRADKLMTPTAVEQYLSQHAPVPFAPEFSHGAEIAAALQTAGVSTDLEIHIGGSKTPLYRPHRDFFDSGNGRTTVFEELEIRELPNMDGGPAAIAWVLHHSYEGAIPQANGIKGLRMRAGDVQVGDDHILEELFAEQRFNSWCVGEIHVLDRRVIPNGRRDNFEQNVHHNNLLNHLSPIVRDISRRCRNNSIRRNWIRKFEGALNKADTAAHSLQETEFGASQRYGFLVEATGALEEAGRIASLPILADDEHLRLMVRVNEARTRLEQAEAPTAPSEELVVELPAAGRIVMDQVVALIREYSTDQQATRVLVERILKRLGSHG